MTNTSITNESFSPSILVVEDFEENRVLLGCFLEHYKSRVTFACDGAEAVNCVRKEDFDIVLMDMDLPIMDGLEATKEIRKIGFEKPIIALTAYSESEYKNKAIAAGCDDSLSKPIDFPILFKKLDTCLQKA